MKVVVQRSLNAKCIVDGKIVGESKKGLVLLVGFTHSDTIDEVKYLAKKVLNLRIFDDENGVMNKSILDVPDTSILSISQFTLYGDAKKGNRPSYINAMHGEEAKKLYDAFNVELGKEIKVATGIFGSDMKIDFINDGPITILLER